MKLVIGILIAASSIAAQSKPKVVEPCSLTIDQVPLIRSLRLGQPYEHLQKAIPRIIKTDDEPDELGIRRVSFSSAVVDPPELLNGIRYVSLTYFDDSLVSISITYDNSVKWQSNLHFAAAVIQQLKLPRVGWLQRDPSYLICQGFVLEVANGTFAPQLRLIDSMFPDGLAKRKEQIEERKRARFKP